MEVIAISKYNVSSSISSKTSYSCGGVKTTAHKAQIIKLFIAPWCSSHLLMDNLYKIHNNNNNNNKCKYLNTLIKYIL